MTIPYALFTEFNTNTDIVALRSNEVTTGLWSGDTGSLTQMFTSSVQVNISGEFYYDMYNLNPATDDSAEIQFSVAYGHISGSGSPPLSATVLNANSTLPTQVTYVQYRNILMSDNSDKFTFGDGTKSNDIYVINIQRSRLRQAIDPGNWQLSLSGSNGVFTFIDDSGLKEAVAGNLTANNVYHVRSGSLTTTPGIVQDNKYYGLVFPDYGVIILNPGVIASTVGFAAPANSVRGGVAAHIPFTPYTGSNITNYLYPHEGLVRSISGSMRENNPFIARSAEKITSTNYFVRLGNKSYNYSNNPTYFTGSLPRLPLEPFRVKPITYATTIGLYNATNELLAVAKLSRPIQKSDDKEALIRVRLDY